MMMRPEEMLIGIFFFYKTCILVNLRITGSKC